MATCSRRHVWEEGEAPQSKNPLDSQIVMFQRIAPGHCDPGGALDVGELLRWADLATCAAAEAHCEGNCVTVSVSDMSFENSTLPTVGDIVELRATPVAVGNTSMVISLLVLVQSRKLGKRVAFSTAQFTYVMRPEDGVKKKVPPLDTTKTLEARYAAFLAGQRKKVLLKESSSDCGDDHCCMEPVSEAADGCPVASTTVRMTELVLPPHTNHMNNTFGGQIMAWMHKAAFITAQRHAHKDGHEPILITRAVSSVDFPKPSKAADHLLFTATVERVFAPNNMLISVHVQKRVILQGSRIETINNGLFHIEAFTQDKDPANVREVTPDPDDKNACGRFKHLAWRWQLMKARGFLFGFRGGPLPLIKTLMQEAYNTTIEGVLRLLPSDNVDVVNWESLFVGLDGFQAWLATDLWGQDQLCFKITMTCPGLDSKAAFGFLQDASMRSHWDPICRSFEKLEDISENSDIIVMRVEAATDVHKRYGKSSGLGPLAHLFGAGFQHGCRKCMADWCPDESTVGNISEQLTPLVVEFPLFRCWRSADNEHLIAFRSVQHARYEKCDGGNVRLPTGWVVQPIAGGCQITHVLQVVQSVAKSLGLDRNELRTIMKGYCESMLKLKSLTYSSTR